METLILSLDESPPLFNELKNEIPCTVFRGYKRKDITSQDYEKYFCKKSGESIQDSVYGCAYSHIKIWEYIVQSNCDLNKFWLILEDDAFFNLPAQKTLEILEETIDNITASSSQTLIFYPGWLNPFKSLSLEQTLYPKIFKSKTIYGTHSYCVSKQTAKVLLEKTMSAIKCSNHIDWHISELANRGYLQLYAFGSNDRIIFQYSTQPVFKMNHYKNTSFNVQNTHPILLLSLAALFKIDEGMNFAYILSATTRQIFGYNVSLITLFWCLLGFIVGYAGFNWQAASLIFLTILIPDFLYNCINIKYKQVFIDYGLFMFIHYIVTLAKKK